MFEKQLSRRRLLKLSALGGSALLLAACQPREVAVDEPAVTEAEAPGIQMAVRTPGQMVYWHPWGGTFGDLVDRIAEAFMEDHPDINVTVTRTDWAVYMARLLTGVAAGTPPDAAMVWNAQGRVYTLADRRAIVPLEAVAEPGELEELEAAVHPPIWELGEFEGKVYGVPQWSQAYMLYYNKQLMLEEGVDIDNPPQTFDELDDLADSLYDFDDRGNLRRIGFNPTWLQPWMPSFEGQWLDANGDPSLNHPNNIETLEWMSGYAKRYDWTRISEFRGAQEGGSPQNPLLIGRYAIEHSGPWLTGVLLEYKPEDWEYGLWMMPQHPDRPGVSVFTYGDVPCIPRNNRNPEAAWQFVKYLTGVTNPDAYAALWSIGRRPHMPISQEVADSSAFARIYEQFPGFKDFVDFYFSADRYLYAPKIAIADYMVQRMDAWRDRCLLGETTPEEALETAQQEVMDEWQRYQAEKLLAQ